MTLLIIEFFIFSFIGWIVDSLYRSLIKNHKLVNAGYFRGPICPIYGIGGVLLLYVLKNFIFLPFPWLMIVATLFMVSLEYFGGKFSERFLHVRLWDYRQSKFNLDGYIDLLHSFYWLVLVIFFYLVLFKQIIYFETIIYIPSFLDFPITLITFLLFVIAILRKNPTQFLEMKDKIINLNVGEYADLFKNYKKSLSEKNLINKEKIKKKINFYLEKANIKIKNFKDRD